MLNLLPTKSWNVWNKKNQEKVEEDVLKNEKEELEQEIRDTEFDNERALEFLRKQKNSSSSSKSSNLPSKKQDNVNKSFNENAKDKYKKDKETENAKKLQERMLERTEDPGISRFDMIVLDKKPKNDNESDNTQNQLKTSSSIFVFNDDEERQNFEILQKMEDSEKKISTKRKHSKALKTQKEKKPPQSLEELRKKRLEREERERKKQESLKKDSFFP